ncbi:glycosyl hydrolase family 16 laminarinase (macronuclear) [Tetrahymena thermophila SB210]|uniref:Glycosyl hydrolase family 16 laminarinase n=1 Tax=Tetrahymena thermophila (strain SB210) TaxID=312017 RepID=Q246C2_TETTS|nr:glycosyl hydrolase family 16 laminarinase [Tetrahymena thermophila SB210]EAS03461.2 glycosyl hydrolase family 16 laminarinase [Tetrahymena thermophila SB210]|eukprot:XP_001023706.2 glycosyl hydrolase family 16 laminarinase [Tetrahymena thermophila SB210]
MMRTQLSFLIVVCLLISLSQAFLKQKNQTAKIAIPSIESLRNQEWVEIFRDDFDGDKLDTRYWTARNNMTHTDWEQQLYIEEDVYVENGNLVLRTRFNPKIYQPTQRLYNYTSGWVDSSEKFNYMFGYTEARIKIPKVVLDDPIWPAFWSIGEGTYWPNGGEIDTMEMSATWNPDFLPHIQGTYHWGKDGDQCNACGTEFPYYLDFSEYHTYTTVWNATQIDWYVDGILYRTNVNGTIYEKMSSPVDLPHYNQFLIINDALWGEPTPNPQDYPKYMYIDYVTVLQTRETYESQRQQQSVA